MKTLRVSQCSIGKYNMLSNDESLSFYMVIEEDGKVIVDGENRASIYYSGDADDIYDFKRAVEDNDIQFLFDKCFSYSNRVWGTTDYEGNCLLFAKLYIQNFDELSENKAKKEREWIEKKIEELQKRLTFNLGIDDYRDAVKDRLQDEISKYEKFIADNEKEISQYKEGSGKITELQEIIKKYQGKIAKYKKLTKISLSTDSKVAE